MVDTIDGDECCGLMDAITAAIISYYPKDRVDDVVAINALTRVLAFTLVQMNASNEDILKSYNSLMPGILDEERKFAASLPPLRNRSFKVLEGGKLN